MNSWISARVRGLSGERHDGAMELAEVRERRPAGRSPCSEASLHRRDRVRRVFARRDEVERGAHQSRLHDLAAVDGNGEPVALESREARPQCDIWGWCPLPLKAGESLDCVDHVQLLALQEELTRQQRTVQLTKGKGGSASGHRSMKLGQLADYADDLPWICTSRA